MFCNNLQSQAGIVEDTIFYKGTLPEGLGSILVKRAERSQEPKVSWNITVSSEHARDHCIQELKQPWSPAQGLYRIQPISISSTEWAGLLRPAPS